MDLTPNAGFDWSRVKWGAPDEPASDVCSYCGDEKLSEVPLRLFSKHGHGAVFCVNCERTWFGLESFDDDDEHD